MTSNIRQNVFETNSSSTHSVSLEMNGGKLNDTIVPDENGNIVLSGGDFSHTELYITDALRKANFVAVYNAVYGDEKLKDRLVKVLKEITGAKEIIFDITMSYADGKPANSKFSSEYTDPYCDSEYMEEDENDDEESEEVEVSFKTVLKDEKLLKQFIFNKSNNISAEIGYN